MQAAQNPESLQDYRKILESHPADEPTVTYLIVLLIQTERVVEAREMCRNFHAAGGVSVGVAVNAVYFFGHLIYDEDGIDIAYAMLERARQRYPENVQLWLSSFWLSSQKHDYRWAMSHAAKAAALNSNSVFQCMRIHTPLSV